MDENLEHKEDQLEIINNFDDMNLKENLLRGIYSYGFEKPSLIQSKSIPLIMKGKDLIAQSQSGTGKTGAFTIGMLQLINEEVIGCQGIIVAHTRELAQQIFDVISNLAYYTKIKIVLCMGGQDIRQTRKDLDEKKPIIVICTPGRILDLIKRRFVSTRFLKLLVIDEADEMLSTSFLDQLKNIILQIPQTTQICLFSATMPNGMLRITEKFMRDPERILIERENLTLEGIRQFYIKTEKELWKFETLCDLYEQISVSQTIIYVNSIRRGQDLKAELENKQFTVSLIHSNMNVYERNVIMKEFRNGATRILISTDLLSRGIDIQQISVVVNYDIPRNKDCYLHRIGRSGRFGRKGVAINLVTRNDERALYDIQDYYKIDIDPMPQNIQQFMN